MANFAKYAYGSDLADYLDQRIAAAERSFLATRRPRPPRSEWLTGVKYRLNHLGYGAGPAVHVHDDRCKRAIRAFQRDYRLRVDAIPGPKTQAKLAQVCGY